MLIVVISSYFVLFAYFFVSKYMTSPPLSDSNNTNGIVVPKKTIKKDKKFDALIEELKGTDKFQDAAKLKKDQ